MAWSRQNIHAIALILINIMWSTLIGLFVPRTPTFGLIVLALVVPSLIVIALKSREQTSSQTPSNRADVPAWICYGSTTGIALAAILKKSLPESFLEFIVLTVFLSWPWLAICIENTIEYKRLFGRSRSFLLSLTTSICGIAIGLVIYLIRHTQVMSIFFTLLLGSILCLIVILITDPKKGKQNKIV